MPSPEMSNFETTAATSPDVAASEHDDADDSEFEVSAEMRADEDDDSIAADEDIADEEEVDSLMRESEMSLSDLLAVYGLPAPAENMPSVSSASSEPTSGPGRSMRKRRQITQPQINDSSEPLAPTPIGGDNYCTLEGPQSPKIQRKSSESETSAESDVVILAVTETSSLPPQATQQLLNGDHCGSASGSASEGFGKDDGEEEEADGDDDEEEYAPASCSPNLWCRALAAGDSPPMYNSEEDEDYHPNVEGDGYWRGEMRVGEDYQAIVGPQPLTGSRNDSHLGFDCRLLWRPVSTLSDGELERYQQSYAKTLSIASPTMRTPDDEEALFLLMQTDYDADEALQRLQFKPVHPTEVTRFFDAWSEADCSAFERGFITHNKNFHEIQQSKLRHKTVAELVHFYYLWKKTARHDDFVRVYRREKKKPLHPGITDFMDCLVQEQYCISESLSRNPAQAGNIANNSNGEQGGAAAVRLGPQEPPSSHVDFDVASGNLSVVSVPKCSLSVLDSANPARMSSLGASLRELEDDPEVSISPRLQVVDPIVSILNPQIVNSLDGLTTSTASQFEGI